jgi:hypothetical protein
VFDHACRIGLEKREGSRHRSGRWPLVKAKNPNAYGSGAIGRGELGWSEALQADEACGL